jgi:phytoene dehydrogenase-like protein
MTNRPKDRPSPTVKPLDASSAGKPAIRRRDFLNGLLVGASSVFLAPALQGCGGEEGSKPVPPTGAQFKGDNMNICHAVRDGKGWTLPEPTNELYDCVVIGGGVSGLVATRRLQLLGVTNVLLLEKESPVGGVARVDGEPGHLYAQGAAYTVYPYNDNLYEVYEDLGIITGFDGEGAAIVDPKYLVKSPSNSDFVDGKWYLDSWEEGMDALPYSPQIVADLKAFREDMLVWYNYVGKDGKLGFDTPTDNSTEDPEVRALDNMTLAEYVASKGWAPEVSAFFNPYTLSAMGTTHDKVSAWAAIGFLGAEFQPVLAQPGGNGHLSNALAAKIGADTIKTGAFVLRVKNVGDEVHISYLEGDKVTTVRARTAVYAANRYIAKHVMPELGEAGRNEAADFNYTAAIVANVHVTRTPGNVGYDNWVQGQTLFFTDFIVADWAGLEEPQKAPLDRANTLSLYCPLPHVTARAELLVKPFEEYEEIILADLERILPGVRETVTGVDIYRWGHAMVRGDKGFIFSKSRVGAQAPQGRVSFACSDIDGLPAFENAVGSAYRATAEVAKLLDVKL